jgi:hypothetical protein
MNAARARAGAASVLDALGADFWAWWRATVGGGLLVLLLGLGLMATADPAERHWGFSFGVILMACAVAIGLGGVAIKASQRHARWQRMQAQRRLPCTLGAARWDAVGYTLLGAWAWCAGALMVAAIGAQLNEATWANAWAWLFNLLAVTSIAAAIGRPIDNWPAKLLLGLLSLQVFFGRPLVMTATNSSPGQLLALGAVAAGLLVWTFRRQAVGPVRRTLQLPPLGSLAGDSSAKLGAWLRANRDRLLRGLILPVLGAPILVAVFVPLPSLHAGIWQWWGWQIMVLGFTAAYWHVPPHHWRLRVTPRFARQRASLALTLCWRECQWLVPVFVVSALVSSQWAWDAAKTASSTDRLLSIAHALPWFLANLGLLMAGAVLWVGLRRGHRALDLLFVPLWAACQWMDYLSLGEPQTRVNWSGRFDILAAMLLATLLVLALASWVWRRGSLAGIDRWGPASLKPRP